MFEKKTNQKIILIGRGGEILKNTFLGNSSLKHTSGYNKPYAWYGRGNISY